jgi:K+-sensing histidine kinase KdpD
MDAFHYGNDMIGKHHSILLPAGMADTETYKNFWDDLRRGETKQGNFHRINKYGGDVYIMGTYVPIFDKSRKNVVKILKLAQDNTEKFKAFEEIHNKNVYLEHAAKILRHDMHSGINTYIPRGLKSLKRRLGKDKIKELKIETPLKLISEGLAHTQQVYKGVFEFTNLVKEGAKLQTEKIQLNDLLKCYLKRTSYFDKVKVDWLPKAQVNPSLFCTAIDNLIRNGLRYNDSDTKWVRITSEQEKNSFGLYDNYIFIEDNGRGMTNEEFFKFAKPYVRKEGQLESGSGLGLNICNLILKEHGFSIFCEKTDTGTKVSIKL